MILPEQELWQAVIYQAFADATRDLSSGNPRRKTHETLGDYAKRRDAIRRRLRIRKLEAKQAQTWLLSSHPDMIQACEFAGYDPDVIREKAELLSRSDWPPRVEDCWSDAQPI
jgi:hypothetical protein